MAKSVAKPTTVTVEESAGILIEIPALLDLPMGYLPRIVKADLNRKQRETLKRLTETLQSRSEQLEDGKYVSRPVDAVRWLLEQIAFSE